MDEHLIQPLHLILISGSLRSQSVNGSVIATLADMVPAGAEAAIYRGIGDLPHFNPDHDRDPLPEAVADLRAQLRRADAVLVSTPEYAGSMPGSFKNMLDWTVGGASLYGMPVGWINPSAHGGSQDTYHALRIVLDRAGAEVVENACVAIAVPRDAVGATGLIDALDIRTHFGRALEALLTAARKHRAAAEQND
ncbi:NADPH-dependent FMN reductase [Rhodoblastus sphagnicola]|uniref:NADPH-dependent FMN reductase n=1 Tax=Rhodoblastus sphagnicola TaxID=333368 RepID=A0A2S6NEY4_9HYPH|nr:NADPH-dependent FMN reductase [Rhodoblastus sphagnicola]MBB4200500.1 NAD(P)H-dependent FMN reductase [Rhodoblastus sphagnicola]PPQ33176.1 NADPH-dependent FMN reductase [Rhodoblastus sphagnicola]